MKMWEHSCGVIHDGAAEPKELIPLKWLGKEIGNHVIGWTIMHGEISIGFVVNDKIESNINVTCALGAGVLLILLK